VGLKKGHIGGEMKLTNLVTGLKICADNNFNEFNSFTAS
jgi:hypothetical protein